MAVTITLYDHTAKKFANGENAEGDTYTVMLFSSGTFTASHTTLANVTGAATEVAAGTGYTTGGQNLASVAVTTVTTNDAKFDAADLTWTASGGSIAAAYACIYNNTDANDPPVAWIDFGGTQTAGSGTDFIISWNASGIFTFTYT